MISFKFGTSISYQSCTNISANSPSGLIVMDPRIFCLFETEKIYHLIPTRRVSKRSVKCGNYPPITALLCAVSDVDDLYEWQKQKIELWGDKYFRSFMANRLKSGTNFHKMMEYLLNALKHYGKIDDQMFHKVDLLMSSENMRACVRSIFPFLKALTATQWMIVEGCVENHVLGYCGRFDAVIELRGVPTLVDWKTISKESIKFKGNIKMEEVEVDVLQVVAYVAAINSDVKYPNVPTILNAALIYAFEDGRSPEILHLNEKILREYHKKLLNNINLFWWRVSNRNITESTVDFVTSIS